MALPPHHPDDIAQMREAITAVVEDVHGHVCTAGLDYLDTEEGKNHRHILGLWDGYEDADVYDEWAARAPELAKVYLDSVVKEHGDQFPTLDEQKARASYEYGFDLFDDVEALMRREQGTQTVYIVRHDNAMEYDSGYDRAFTDWDEAVKLRDYLNAHHGGTDWHAEEEVIYETAQAAIDEWKAEGFIEEDDDA